MSPTVQIVAIISGVIGILTLVLGVVYFIANGLRAEIASLRNEMIARFEALDRDVQRLYERVFKES